MTADGWPWPDSEVTRVVDGDTVDALVHRDLGFGGTASFTVRLRVNRINAPAAHTPAGQVATAFAAAELLGTPVHITTREAYKYGGPNSSPGEWMADVTLPGGTDLSDLMVRCGHAVYWDGTGPRPADD